MVCTAIFVSNPITLLCCVAVVVVVVVGVVVVALLVFIDHIKFSCGQ